MTKEEFACEFERLAHAIQSGVAHDHSTGGRDGEPKHLRVGINIALRGHAALVRLLVGQGVVDEQDYFSAVLAEMEREVAEYEAKLSAKLGAKVELA